MELFDKNKMKESLIKGREIEQKLVSDYKDKIPENILNGAINLFNEDIPHRINVLIGILNSVENDEKYNEVNNINEVLNFLDNDEIEASIELALDNENYSHYSPLKEEKLTFKDILENLKYAIDSDIEQLYHVELLGNFKN